MATETSTSRRSLTPTGPWIPGGWLAIAFAAAALVAAAYVATHPHPAYEGGLYLQIVDEILANGYRLPDRIPGYTAEGIPFAYPPLMFYVVAVVVDLTGADPVTLMRVLPAAIVVIYLVPFYAVANELLESPRQAGFATLLFAVTPPVLQWHLSAGGLVRAPAMLLTLTGLYTGVKLFSTGERRWLVASIVLWGLTVLTHPVYTVFFGWSYLLLYAALDRTWRGLLDGAAVCVGGLVLAAPWWLTVAAAHGPEIFLGASGTRTTLGGGEWRLLTQFVFPITAANALTPFYLAAYGGSIYALLRRRYLLGVWTLSAAYLLGTPRFTFVAGSMVAAVLVFEFLVPLAGDVLDRPVGRRAATLGLVVLVAAGAAGVGVAYSASALNTAHQDSPSQPETVQPADMDAMEWAGAQTDPDATFLVLGDAAEWFPYYSDRTILVSPWGTEWTTPEEFREHVSLYTGLSTCDSTACLEAGYAGAGELPDYVYVPAQDYTIRGEEHDRPDRLVASLQSSDRYEMQFAGGDVLVFTVVEDPDPASAPGRPSPTGGGEWRPAVAGSGTYPATNAAGNSTAPDGNRHQPAGGDA